MTEKTIEDWYEHATKGLMKMAKDQGMNKQELLSEALGIVAHISYQDIKKAHESGSEVNGVTYSLYTPVIVAEVNIAFNLPQEIPKNEIN